MSGRYTWVPGEPPRTADDPGEWGEWFGRPGNRRVARDTLAGGVLVSTVFLGLDHNHARVGPPVLFETMVFGGGWTHFCERYATEAEARAGHARIVLAVSAGRAPDS